MKTLNIFLLVVIFTTFDVKSAKDTFYLYLESHLFYPSELVIPANKKVKLIIENKDSTPEEFDSFDLNREKVIYPGRKVTIYIGPLKPGRYEYFGEFNPNTALGTIIVESDRHVH
ncbi:MAG: cupredoxin domain-containing protein [Gammaproteobacteria bacterium]|nr:cupredoxin domain-containing protein [Gammaproteobacteria bacterium]